MPRALLLVPALVVLLLSPLGAGRACAQDGEYGPPSSVRISARAVTIDLSCLQKRGIDDFDLLPPSSDSAVHHVRVFWGDTALAWSWRLTESDDAAAVDTPEGPASVLSLKSFLAGVQRTGCSSSESVPVVTTLEDTEASIVLGDAYLAAPVVGAVVDTAMHVGIEMRVTPHVESDSVVLVEFEARVSDGEIQENGRFVGRENRFAATMPMNVRQPAAFLSTAWFERLPSTRPFPFLRRKPGAEVERQLLFVLEVSVIEPPNVEPYGR